MRGEDLKGEGMQTALFAVMPWPEMARQAIEALAMTGKRFTSEDVVSLVGLPRPSEGTNRNNAVGAAMSGAARAGVIERVGYEKARRDSSHARVLAVWEGTR